MRDQKKGIKQQVKMISESMPKLMNRPYKFHDRKRLYQNDAQRTEMETQRDSKIERKLLRWRFRTGSDTNEDVHKQIVQNCPQPEQIKGDQHRQ